VYHPTLDEVRGLNGQGNTIPVYRKLPADLETPVSVYLKLRGEGPSFLLESVERAEQVGRYSFVGVDPAASLITRGDRALIVEREGVRTELLQGPGSAMAHQRSLF